MKLLLTVLIVFSLNLVFSQKTYLDYLPVREGNTLFYDEFENNENNWFIGETDDFFSSIEKGEMLMGNNSDFGSWAQWKTFYLNPENEFSIETSIRQYAGFPENVHGIIWGATDWNNLFCFCISSNGFFKIFKIDDGEYSDIKEWKESKTILPKYYNNILNVSNRNDTTFFYINNEIVYFKKEIKIYGAKYGILIDGKIKIKVDYFKIIHPEYQKDVTGYPITIREIRLLDIKEFPEQIIKYPIYDNTLKRLYISASTAKNKFDIYFSEKNTSGEFSEIQLFDTSFNNSFDNSVINTFEEGKSIILNSVYISDSTNLNGISYSRYDDTIWTFPKEIIIENTYNLEKNTDYFISADKKYLLSTIKKLDTHGQRDIYISLLTEKGYYSEPVNIGDSINTYGDENTVFLCSDNKTLFFASNTIPGFGGYDIFVIQRIDDTWTNWSKPQNLGPVINSTGNETCFYIDNDNFYGYYISDKEGFTNLYQFFVFDTFFKKLK